MEFREESVSGLQLQKVLTTRVTLMKLKLQSPSLAQPPLRGTLECAHSSDIIIKFAEV